MIRNIIFDMGQVLIRWHPELLIAHLGLPEDDRKLVIREVFHSVEWVRLDRGTISEEDAAASICRRLPACLHAGAETLVKDWWKRPLVPMPGMAELVGELKANGYGIYLLSNASLRLREYFHRIPGSEHFDGLMVSAEQKLLKPQHEIYTRLFEAFSLKPEECFFIDDAPVNIEGALQAGMPGAIFRGDVTALRRELRENGIRCNP